MGHVPTKLEHEAAGGPICGGDRGWCKWWEINPFFSTDTAEETHRFLI